MASAEDADGWADFGACALVSSNVPLSTKQAETADLWMGGSIGAGFPSGRQEFGFGVGGGFAARVIGGQSPHDLVLSRTYYGVMLSDVLGKDRFYQGNLEMMLELFAGGEVRPGNGYVVGGAVLLRYNFATGSRLMPFIDIGAGLTGTDLGEPDLGSIFEFNLQGGAGIQYFWRENSAITFQYRLIHFSNADIKSPNLGVNENMFYIGMSWFF